VKTNEECVALVYPIAQKLLDARMERVTCQRALQRAQEIEAAALAELLVALEEMPAPVIDSESAHR
jgi:hypothetical protein